MNHFFNIDSDFFINGLASGNFATVKKRVEFLNITNEKEITQMLQEEVKIRKSSELKNAIGF